MATTKFATESLRLGCSRNPRRTMPVLLLAMWSTVGLTSTGAQTADLVIRHANVLQCNDQMEQAEAIAVKDGRIMAVGTDDEIASWINDQQTTLVNANGKTITPGLTDSHVHFVGLGQSLQMLDLSDATSWQEIVDQVQQAALAMPKGSWIEGRGWHQSKWSVPPKLNVDGYPNHLSMSAVVPDHPVVLTHASGHALFANDAAMKLADVGPDTPNPEGGKILRDDSGRAIGVFLENAGGRIRRAVALADRNMSDEDRREQMLGRIQLAGEACLQNGITSVHDAGTSFAGAAMLRQFAESNELPVRMTVMIRAGSQSLSRRIRDSRWIGIGDGFLTVRSVKVSIDGALGSHGAWLLEPYSDLPTKRGMNTTSVNELEKIAELCKEHRWQLCVHAIGDRANREVLDIYEKVLGQQIAADHRWRVEHAQHLSPDDIPRFAELGVIPAMQANHCTSDAIFVPTRLGQRRSVQGAYVWRSLIDAGSIIPNGTDAPVEKIDPRASLYASVTRQLVGGEAFYPEQCMTRAEALLSYTLWPAKAAFVETDLGSVEVGKRADLVMWDTDLLTCQPKQIPSAEVKQVWVGGKSKL